MYIINLPDEVMIPDALLAHAEEGKLGKRARTDAIEWVKQTASDEDSSQRIFWRKRITRNVEACERYNVPDYAEFFDYVRKLIDEAW